MPSRTATIVVALLAARVVPAIAGEAWAESPAGAVQAQFERHWLEAMAGAAAETVPLIIGRDVAPPAVRTMGAEAARPPGAGIPALTLTGRNP